VPSTLTSIPDLTPTQVVVGLLGGLALFLLGLGQLTDSVQALAGRGLKRWVGRLTSNRFSGAATGASVSAVLQSSSATTVLVVGLVSAGVLSLEQSLGVLLGANVGTTVTAQIVAFDVARIAVVFASGGLALALLAPRGPLRHAGAALFGLGLVFAGMGLMTRSAGPLQGHEAFLEAMTAVAHPLSAVLAGAVFTALVQSSSATVGVVIVLAGRGLVSLEASVALVLGANLGTCVTACIAALGRPRPAVQAALAHLAFNLLGVVVWLPLLGPLAELVRQASPGAPPGLPEAERVAEALPRQVANAHLVFNLGTALLLIGFTSPLARAIRRIVPDRPGPGRGGRARRGGRRGDPPH
jgi:phosphate:Na+ symporter